jgi:hypothetical protein
MLLCDFHVHSNFSDGAHSIAELVDHYGKAGFDCLAITDHLCEESSLLGRGARFLGRTLTRSTFPRYLEELHRQARRAWKVYDLVLLPGVEITKNHFSNVRSAHYLGIGIENLRETGIDPDLPIVESLQELRTSGALTVAAHPLGTDDFEAQTLHLWSSREALAPLFDAWEVGSGRKTYREVMESGLPILANSDLHHLKQLESWKTLLHADKDRESIFDAIRQQRLVPWFFRNGEKPPCLTSTDRRKRDYEARLGA